MAQVRLSLVGVNVEDKYQTASRERTCVRGKPQEEWIRIRNSVHAAGKRFYL